MTCKQYLAYKQYPDHIFNKNNGKFFGEKYYNDIIKEDFDCYFINDNGEQEILFKFRKNVINKKMSDLIISIFKDHAKKQNNQRAKASGGKRLTSNSKKTSNFTRSDTMARSNIVGYYDKPKMTDKKYFKTNTVCRTTAFTKNNFNEWSQSIPFFNIVSKYYKQLAPKHFKLQQKEIEYSPYSIGKTPFTTITVNYNWRTACHKDKGDYSLGMGNLVVLGQDYDGGYLGFPQFKVAVDVRPGDLIIMNVHQWHCNTELKLNKNSLRLSFVCYMRENMSSCNKKKIINGEEMYYKN